jgi:hypothetical protein
MSILDNENGQKGGSVSNDELSFKMTQFIFGKVIAQAIYVAAELDIAELLVDRPKSVVELAAITQTKVHYLGRILRSLASMGIFEGDGKGHYGLTPLADKLRSDAPGSVRGLARMCGGEFTWGPYGKLIETVRTGETAFRLYHGIDLFDFLQKNSEAGDIFNAAMREANDIAGPALLGGYDFSGIKVLADIGGGHGQMLGLILGANPEMQGVLYDLPHVLEGAGPFLTKSGVIERVKMVSGSFTQEIPSGADAYMLKSIIHDWDDNVALEILKNVRAAIPKGGRLLLIEVVLTEDNEPSFGKLIDIEMMAVPGGVERTREEYESLLSEAGFKLSDVYGKGMVWQIIEGLPV